MMNMKENRYIFQALKQTNTNGQRSQVLNVKILSTVFFCICEAHTWWIYMRGCRGQIRNMYLSRTFRCRIPSLNASPPFRFSNFQNPLHCNSCHSLVCQASGVFLSMGEKLKEKTLAKNIKIYIWFFYVQTLWCGVRAESMLLRISDVHKHIGS